MTFLFVIDIVKNVYLTAMEACLQEHSLQFLTATAM